MAALYFVVCLVDTTQKKEKNVVSIGEPSFLQISTSFVSLLHRLHLKNVILVEKSDRVIRDAQEE